MAERDFDKYSVAEGGVSARWPVRVGRRVAAEIVTDHFFPVSHRTLERWPLRWRRVNGRALVETADLLAEAQRRVDEAPQIMGAMQ